VAAGDAIVKFLIADDHPIMLIGLRQLILGAWPQAGVESAQTVDEACTKASGQSFDAIVLDLVMPDVAGTEGVARMLQAAGPTPVLVISSNAESAFAARLLQMGIAGYLPKAMAATELAVALQRLLQGKRYVTAAMADHLVDRIGGRTGDRPVHEALSSQEHRVMLLIAEGMPPAQIAELMHLSAKTVGTYRARIFEKTGWKSNVELSKYCLQHGLTSSG
jgi:two-component system, NarL family, invasion response regulator UvrY